MPDRFQNALHRMAIRRVPANLEFAGEPVQEAGGRNSRQTAVGDPNLLAAEHAQERAIDAPDLMRCKDCTYGVVLAVVASLRPLVMNQIAIF
jgi:hypothetical protein